MYKQSKPSAFVLRKMEGQNAEVGGILGEISKTIRRMFFCECSCPQKCIFNVYKVSRTLDKGDFCVIQKFGEHSNSTSNTERSCSSYNFVISRLPGFLTIEEVI